MCVWKAGVLSSRLWRERSANISWAEVVDGIVPIICAFADFPKLFALLIVEWRLFRSAMHCVSLFNSVNICFTPLKVYC